MRFGRLALLSMSLLVSQPASAAWQEAKSKHFIIYSEQKPDQLRRYAEELERFDQAVRKLRGMPDPDLTDSGHLVIYTLPDQQAVTKMYGLPGGGIAGFYISRASGSVAFVHRERGFNDPTELNAQTVFFHEYLHHLMLQQADVALPGWLVEGSAELFATTRFDSKGSVLVGQAPGYRAYGLAALNHMSLAELVGATYRDLDDEEFEQVYAEGWLLSHYLTFEPSRRGQLGRYVQGIQSGRSALESAQAAFGDLKQLNRELLKYRDRSRLAALSIRASDLPIGLISIRPLDPDLATALPIVMRSAVGRKKRMADVIRADARRLAARYPSSPSVQTALAQAELDAEDYPSAVAAADRALAAVPNSARAMIVKARAWMELAEKNGGKADWKLIRGYLTKTNRMDPDHAEPLMLFYKSYLVEGVAPTRNAVNGLLYARGLVPQDDELRMLAVRQLIADAKWADASKAYGPLAYNPHAGKARDRRLKVMAALQSANGKEAERLLDEEDAEQKKKED